jgi:hypothetical protein
MPRSEAAVVSFHHRYRVEDHGYATPCWQWTGSITSYGYGQFHADGLQCRALRFAYTHFVGEIPDGLSIDHLCRNKACVNPAHLEAVPLEENIRRMHAAKTRCKHGHPWTEENLIVDGAGRRYCRICRAARLERAAKKRRAAYVKIPRAPRTHCLRGHEFTPENTIIRQGCRLCRICRESSLASYVSRCRTRYASDRAYRERRQASNRKSRARAA